MEQITWLEDAAAELRERSVTVIQRACRDLDDGTGRRVDERVAGGRYDEDGSAPGRVPAMVLARFRDGAWHGDPVETAVRDLVSGVMAARAALLGALDAAGRLRGMGAEEAAGFAERVRELQGRASGYCANCGRWVSGTDEDRLRAGRCEACYRFRQRHGADRPLSEVERERVIALHRSGDL
jgi:hypothetical protein